MIRLFNYSVVNKLSVPNAAAYPTGVGAPQPCPDGGHPIHYGNNILLVGGDASGSGRTTFFNSINQTILSLPQNLVDNPDIATCLNIYNGHYGNIISPYKTGDTGYWNATNTSKAAYAYANYVLGWGGGFTYGSRAYFTLLGWNERLDPSLGTADTAVLLMYYDGTNIFTRDGVNVATSYPIPTASPALWWCSNALTNYYNIAANATAYCDFVQFLHNNGNYQCIDTTHTYFYGIPLASSPARVYLGRVLSDTDAHIVDPANWKIYNGTDYYAPDSLAPMSFSTHTPQNVIYPHKTFAIFHCQVTYNPYCNLYVMILCAENAVSAFGGDCYVYTSKDYTGPFYYAGDLTASTYDANRTRLDCMNVLKWSPDGIVYLSASYNAPAAVGNYTNDGKGYGTYLCKANWSIGT